MLMHTAMHMCVCCLSIRKMVVLSCVCVCWQAADTSAGLPQTHPPDGVLQLLRGLTNLIELLDLENGVPRRALAEHERGGRLQRVLLRENTGSLGVSPGGRAAQMASVKFMCAVRAGGKAA